jgi:hypothetical protein
LDAIDLLPNALRQTRYGAPTTAATQDVGKYEVHVFVTVNPPTTNQIHTEDLESLKKEVLDQAIRELSTRPSSFGAADSK